MSAADVKVLRRRLVDVEIEIDALERWPLRRDLGWSKVRLTLLRAEAARLRQTVHVVRALGGDAL